ncbi:MAG: phosphoribosylglycinamide formyltransferase [Acidobacteriota bacterium]
MLNEERPLRVAVLASRRAPGLSDLLAARDASFEIVCVLSSEEDFADAALVRASGVPLLSHPIGRFCRWQKADLRDLRQRRDYDRATERLLAPYRPDLVLLSGYVYIVTRPLLDAYPGRLVNVHGSDLARRTPKGRPLYPGLRAVRDAIRSGETETRATAHLVTETLDGGPVLLRSPAFPVAPVAAALRAAGADHALNAYAYAHQEWMLSAAWGPLLAGAARLFAREREPRENDESAIRVAAGGMS